MPITRHFLGWDGPALPRAAVYLRDQLGRGDCGWDMGHLVAVVPAQRAGRRLLELLVTLAQADDQALIPPNIVTTGHLPELLYQPTGSQAGDLDEHLAWIAAMRSISPEMMADLLPHPPGTDDLPGWWAYATQVRRLRDDLAGHRMTFADVPRLCAQRGVDLRGEQRWAVLDAIEQAYLQTLNTLNQKDRNTERLDTITAGICVSDESTHIVLIASPDINDTAAAMLRQVGDRITALVMAPDTHADGFDDLGILRAEYWGTQSVDLKPEQLSFVGRNTEQASEVIEVIAETQRVLKTAGNELNADQITVGLGDERFAGPVRRRLDLAGVPARSAAGTPTAQSRPALLLRALSRFMEAQRLDALAELLRHPDIETYLLRHDDGDTHTAIRDAISLLDTYATEHLQDRLTEPWLGNPNHQQRLKRLRDRITALLPEHPAKRLPLPRWSVPIANALQQAYTGTPLREHVPDEHQLALALKQIADRLSEQAELNEQAPTCPQVTASQAIALTLRRLADLVLPDEHDGPAVELLGYLELALDDAPVMAITGMNEGLIPSSRTADAFLPDSVRSRLSMRDNTHRYARDLMLLSAVTHSRPTVKLIAARRSDDGDPLTPSRLLLACGDNTLVERIQSFFSDNKTSTSSPLPVKPGGINRFLIPRPVVAPQPLNILSVTAFRAYLACPYRFYLRHVLKLAVLDDRAVEMDPMSFGSITHEVLQAFGSSDLRDETHAGPIAGFLSSKLDHTIETRFGEDRRPAIRIQTEQLRDRLIAFADQQADLAEQGWRIDRVEQDRSTEIIVDGEPFTVKGKVDRIDRHDTHGWRIYDYKTGDSDKRPEQTHHIGRNEHRSWIDLQLPLYRDLCAGLGIEGAVALGYFNLPKKLDRVGPSMAEWDEHDFTEATETRDAVIRAVREQRFWPPNDSNGLPDGFDRICADMVMQRGELIESSGREGGSP